MTHLVLLAEWLAIFFVAFSIVSLIVIVRLALWGPIWFRKVVRKRLTPSDRDDREYRQYRAQVVKDGREALRRTSHSMDDLPRG